MKDLLIWVVIFFTRKESLAFWVPRFFWVSILGKFQDFGVLRLVKMAHPCLL